MKRIRSRFASTADRGADPWSRLEAHARAGIATLGWSVIVVGTAAGDPASVPAFAYTVGLTHTFAHPELIIVGLPFEHMLAMLNAAADTIKSRGPIETGTLYDGILTRHAVRYRTVPRPSLEQRFPPNMSFHFYGEQIGLLQLLWPDDAGFFPDDPEYDKRFAQQEVVGAGRPPELLM